MVVLLALLIPAVLILTASLVLSFFFTRRYYLFETRSPAELGLPFENVAFPSADGLPLRGWWIPKPGSDRAVIQLHGHYGSMDPDIEYASAWHTAGFNVLMFDFRAHGRSPGKMPFWLAKFLAWITVSGASLRLRADLFHYEPARWIGKIECPLFIIHGDLDQYCPDFQDALETAHPAEIWRLPQIGHVQASQVYPDEYRERIINFLNMHLLKKTDSPQRAQSTQR